MTHCNRIVGFEKKTRPMEMFMKISGQHMALLSLLPLSSWDIRLRNMSDDLTYLVIFNNEPNRD